MSSKETIDGSLTQEEGKSRYVFNSSPPRVENHGFKYIAENPVIRGEAKTYTAEVRIPALEYAYPIPRKVTIYSSWVRQGNPEIMQRGASIDALDMLGSSKIQLEKLKKVIKSTVGGDCKVSFDGILKQIETSNELYPYSWHGESLQDVSFKGRNSSSIVINWFYVETILIEKTEVSISVNSSDETSLKWVLPEEKYECVMRTCYDFFDIEKP